MGYNQLTVSELCNTAYFRIFTCIKIDSVENSAVVFLHPLQYPIPEKEFCNCQGILELYLKHY